MQSLKLLFALPIVAVLFLILFSVFPEVYLAAQDVRTESAQDTGLSCATGAGESTCEITLSSAHAFSDLSGATITETSPASTVRTSDSSLGDDRVTVTVSGLDASESYQFTADYKVQASNLPTGLGEVLSTWPWVFAIGGALVLFAGLAAALSKLS